MDTRMMTVYQNRYHNLRDLIERTGGPAQFADRIGMSRQQLSHVAKDHEPKHIGDRLARRFEAALGLPIGQLDLDPNRPLSVDVNEHIVEVPMLNVDGSMGTGLVAPWQEEVVHRMQISKQWIRQNVQASSFDTLALLTGKGDSMAPTFYDGSILLVDRAVSSIKVDAVYVLGRGEDVYVKRVQRTFDGGLVIKSDNAFYESQTIDNPERSGLMVLGRVLIAWNAIKL